MAKKNNRQLWTDKLLGNGVDLDNGSIVVCRSASNEVTYAKKNVSGIILGVDPSLRGTGVAIVDFTDKNHPKLLFSERINVDKKYSFVDSITIIFQKCSEVLQNFPIIDCAAIEQTIFVQNYQVAQILGAVRGAIISAIGIRGISVYEYAPLRIKQAVIGTGKASKEQINRTMKSLLNIKTDISLDESDAIAAAMCHAWTFKTD